MSASEEAIRQTIRDLITSAAADSEVEAVAVLLTDDARPVERIVIDAIGGGRLEGELKRQRARWSRRAAEKEQIWALWELGSSYRWHGEDPRPRPTPGPRPTPSPTPRDPELVFRDEAKEWIRRAAELGLRAAQLDLGRNADAGSIALLRDAYGDGTEDDYLDQDRVRSAAALLALRLAAVDDPEAESWFLRALSCPWEVDDWSWLDVAWSYACWAHDHDRTNVCLAWSLRIVENAANNGSYDRNRLQGEHKSYRNDCEMAVGKEWARCNAIRHLLDQHEFQPADAMELVRVLTDNREFGADDLLRLRRVVTASSGGTTPVGSLPHVFAGLPDRPITDHHPWSLARWVVADAVPACFRSAGYERESAQFSALVPARLDEIKLWDWQAAANRFDGWSLPVDGPSKGYDWLREYMAEVRVTERYVSRLIDSVGLGAQTSRVQTDRRQTWGDDSLDGQRWRLLRRSDRFVGLYLAAAQETQKGAVSWLETWDGASLWFARAAGVAFKTIVVRECGSFLNDEQINEVIQERWDVLGRTLRWSLTQLVAEMDEW